MARTSLFAGLQRAAALATMTRQSGAPGLDELQDMARTPNVRQGIGRRGLLAAGAGLTLARPHRALAASDPRIAIIGAGLAGLVVADRLVAAGLRRVTLHEANTRIGGRILSGRDLLGAGTTVELGGSFINSEHADMLALARRFDLPLEDGEATPLDTTYFVHGARRTIAEIAAASTDLVAHLERMRALPAEQQDTLSAAAVLDAAGVTGWLRTLLDLGLTQEMGLEPGRMSALYLIDSFAGGQDMNAVGLFGSDQRYQVTGGNDRVPTALAAGLAARIRTGQRLEAVRPAGRAYRAIFAGGGAVEADILVLALPLTTLRQVDMAVPLPPITRRAIAQTTYGTNAKLFAGVSARPWRAARQSGECLNDLGYQTAWEDHARAGTGAGALTIFAGGEAGVGFGRGRPAERARAATASLEPALPGVAAAFNGRSSRMNWPANPYVGGSYTCFAPGQITAFAEAYAPAGGIHFAGEHTSEAHSGYMNGAAESGRLVAEAIQQALA